MSRVLSQLLFLIILLRSSFCLAQLPGATPSPVSASFAVGISSFAADSVRSRVYAAEPTKNRVLVFGTNPLGLIKAILVGRSPQRLVVSVDGSRLFVANSGEKTISVIDLETLAAIATWHLPYHPWDLEEGLDHRLYATTPDDIRGDPAPPGYNGSYGSHLLMQISSTDGTFQRTGGNIFGPPAPAPLEISSDRRTLFLGIEGSVGKIDVSTGTLGSFQFTSLGGTTLNLSHQRQLLQSSKSFIPVATFNHTPYTFATDLIVSASAWSGDDSVSFVGGSRLLDGSPRIDIQSVRTLKTLDSIYPEEVPTALCIDKSGKYLFAANALAARVFDISPRLDGYAPALGALQANLKYQVFPDFDATFSATSLPPGLRIDAVTGLISGTPTQAGKFTARILASRGSLQASRTLAFEIYSMRLLNISTRSFVNVYAGPLIGGFIIQGTPPKKIVVRGLGPSLAAHGVFSPLQSLFVSVYDAGGHELYYREIYSTLEQSIAEIRSLGLLPAYPAEFADIAPLNPGAYTAVLSGASGTGLIEIYDVAPDASSRVVNLSSRAFAGADVLSMIAGVILRGPRTAKILFRAIGPSLSAHHVANFLRDPTLELHDGQGALIRANNNWTDSQQAAIRLTGLAPTNNLESAILVDLPAGNYTAIARGSSPTAAGVALVEVYNLQKPGD